MNQVVIIFKNAIGFFPLFAVFEMMLSLGHLYGTIRYFLWLEDQEFNCFMGDKSRIRNMDTAKPRHYDTGFCYYGELLMCTSWVSAYCSGSIIFMWMWSR